MASNYLQCFSSWTVAPLPGRRIKARTTVVLVAAISQRMTSWTKEMVRTLPAARFSSLQYVYTFCTKWKAPITAFETVQLILRTRRNCRWISLRTRGLPLLQPNQHVYNSAESARSIQKTTASLAAEFLVLLALYKQETIHRSGSCSWTVMTVILLWDVLMIAVMNRFFYSYCQACCFELLSKMSKASPVTLQTALKEGWEAENSHSSDMDARMNWAQADC